MKGNRHAKIIELIHKYNIETQEELADYLHREGFKVTQATVSCAWGCFWNSFGSGASG